MLTLAEYAATAGPPDVAFLGALLGAGASIIGGLIGRKSQKDTNRANTENAAATNAMSLKATRETNRMTDAAIVRNRKWQLKDQRRQFSKLRNRAEAAGFNPLTALGAGASMVPTTQLGSYQTPSFVTAPLASSGMLAQSVANAGAIVGDAVTDYYSQENGLRQANMQLENDLLKAQIEQMRVSATTIKTPPMTTGAGYATAQPPNTKSANEGWISGDTPKFYQPDMPGDKGRPLEMQPGVSVPGFSVHENDWTGPVILPGNDGEVMGFDEALVAGVIGGPQVAKNWGVKAHQYLDERGLSYPSLGSLGTIGQVWLKERFN